MSVLRCTSVVFTHCLTAGNIFKIGLHGASLAWLDRLVYSAQTHPGLGVIYCVYIFTNIYYRLPV